MEQADDTLDLSAQVHSFRQAGNDIAVSLGGQLGTALAVACTDSDALVRSYAAVIKKYGPHFGSGRRRQGPGRPCRGEETGCGHGTPPGGTARGCPPVDAPLKVWLTLPVPADGLTPDREVAVETMLEAGVIGRISMWSLNRDTACTSASDGQRQNAPANNCNGVEQEPGTFAELLGAGYTG